MEIDNRVCEIVRTCLDEQWTVEEVTDEMVTTQIEMILVVAVMHDLEEKNLPRTVEAMRNYLDEEGVFVSEDASDEEVPEV